jgi:hypothetical protein
MEVSKMRLELQDMSRLWELEGKAQLQFWLRDRALSSFCLNS